MTSKNLILSFVRLLGVTTRGTGCILATAESARAILLCNLLPHIRFIVIVIVIVIVRRPRCVLCVTDLLTIIIALGFPFGFTLAIEGFI
jgi:hypothetical protein